MFVYLFVWETLGIPQRHQRETRGAPAGDQQEHQQTNERKSELVHISLIETHQRRPETPQGDHRSTREKLDVIIYKLSGILLTLFVWCVMYLRIIFK